MVIINQLKKAIAALMALTISATSIGAISANAYGITYRNDSAFEYEISARILSDTQIELKIDVTNNPGFHELGFDVHYEGCKPSLPNQCVTACEDGYTLIPVHPYIPELQNWLYTCSISDFTDPYFDYTGNFSLYYNFDVENAYEDICKFSVGVVRYYSHNENIYFDIRKNANLEKYYEPTVKTTHDGIEYIVGDMDNDGIIDISDSSAIGRLVGFTENKQGISVEDLNTIISRGSFDPYNPNHFDCSAEFPDMVCAEVADATGEGKITLEDSEEVLNCYANDMASIPYEGLVGKVDIKEIIVLA